MDGWITFENPLVDSPLSWFAVSIYTVGRVRNKRAKTKSFAACTWSGNRDTSVHRNILTDRLFRWAIILILWKEVVKPSSKRKKLVKPAGLLFYSHTHRSYSTYHVLRNIHSLTTSELLPKLTARLPSNYCIVNKKLLPTVFLITRKNTRTDNRNPEKLLPAFKEIDSCIH